jgi:hypothetical protein
LSTEKARRLISRCAETVEALNANDPALNCVAHDLVKTGITTTIQMMWAYVDELVRR